MGRGGFQGERHARYAQDVATQRAGTALVIGLCLEATTRRLTVPRKRGNGRGVGVVMSIAYQGQGMRRNVAVCSGWHGDRMHRRLT